MEEPPSPAGRWPTASSRRPSHGRAARRGASASRGLGRALAPPPAATPDRGSPYT